MCGVCVCVCVRERECVCERERERECVCVCEREREREERGKRQLTVCSECHHWMVPLFPRNSSLQRELTQTARHSDQHNYNT